MNKELHCFSPNPVLALYVVLMKCGVEKSHSIFNQEEMHCAMINGNVTTTLISQWLYVLT